MTDSQPIPEQRSQNAKLPKKTELLEKFELLDKRRFELTEKRRAETDSCPPGQT